MFTDQNLATLEAQFPTVPPDRIRSLCEWIKTRPDPVRNPMAFASSQLRKIAAQPAATVTPIASQRARGTFREDGSWNADATHASTHERHLREVIATIRRLRLSPATYVDLVFNAPCQAMFRMQSVSQWAKLDAAPKPCQGEHDETAWLQAAWSCAPTTTTAEAWLKACLLGRTGDPPIGTETPAEIAVGQDHGNDWWQA